MHLWYIMYFSLLLYDIYFSLLLYGVTYYKMINHTSVLIHSLLLTFSYKRQLLIYHTLCYRNQTRGIIWIAAALCWCRIFHNYWDHVLHFSDLTKGSCSRDFISVRSRGRCVSVKSGLNRVFRKMFKVGITNGSLLSRSGARSRGSVQK